MQIGDTLYKVNVFDCTSLKKVEVIRIENNLCRVKTLDCDHPSEYWVNVNDYDKNIKDAIFRTHKLIYNKYMEDIQQLKSLEEKFK